jgi:hypothetical protein
MHINCNTCWSGVSPRLTFYLGIALASPIPTRRFGAKATSDGAREMEFPVKVAVATKEGKAVSEHFGHAKRFAIYEVTPESICLLEERSVMGERTTNSLSTIPTTPDHSLGTKIHIST